MLAERDGKIRALEAVGVKLEEAERGLWEMERNLDESAREAQHLKKDLDRKTSEAQDLKAAMALLEEGVMPNPRP
jgi:chromosome segregation ATPase